jgi:translocation and assembly module TamB
MNGSVIEWDGQLDEYTQLKDLEYQLNINKAQVSKDLLVQLSSNKINPWFSVASDLVSQGKVSGNSDSMSVDLSIATKKGTIKLLSNLTFRDQFRYKGQVNLNDLQLDQWPDLNLGNSVISLITRFSGSGVDLNAVVQTQTEMVNSVILGVPIQSATLQASLDQKKLSLSSEIESNAGNTSVNASLDLSREIPSYAIDGMVSQFDASVLIEDVLPKTSVNATFAGEFRGSRLSDIQGRFSFDGLPSVVNGDSISGIQAYADLYTLEDVQQFRLTSTFVDAFISGSYDIDRLIQHSVYWFSTIQDQINTEFLQIDLSKGAPAKRNLAAESIRLEFSASLKQIELLNRFIKNNPVGQANTTISGSILADDQRLLLDISLFDPSTKIKATHLTNVDIKLTTAFQANSSFGETANIQLLSNIGSIQQGKITLEDVTTKGSILDDTLRIDQTIVGFGSAARAGFNIQAALQDSVINVVFPNFFLGNNQYSWKSVGLPALRLLPDDRIEFLDFKFQNDTQQINLSGIFSDDPTDVLGLDVQNLDLSKISELLDLRFDFAGTMNGSIVSRGFRSRSNIEGHLFIDNVAIDGRILGDISLDSEYNPETTVFDTQLRILSDFTVDAGMDTETIVSNKILLSGIIDLETEDPSEDEIFNFQADFEEVNLWAVRYLLLDVFTSMEGKAFGKGNLKGNLNRFEFDSQFTVEDARVSPVFLNTNYVLNGDLRFNDQEGIVFENVRVRDDKRGTGILSGRVDMNDFKPEKFLDLNLRMNRLEFLNNPYDPDVPFYGVVSGSGEVRLSGPNNKPFVQTIRPITVTPNSKLTIPLLDETAINQQTNFIRFVNQFFERSSSQFLQTQTQTRQPSTQNRSFTDIFQLDLQFNMPQDAAIEFIFDPVTNEYLTTRGTGSIRLTLETGNLGMFGSFDIDRGEYNFVGGDIFTKKFKIRPGGTVIWDGLAQDPRIDVVAFFAARPNLAPLGTGRDARVPIDLVLNLKGRLATIENDFYFAYPSNFDTGLSASELSILNSEAQKLLQATSLLITGNFLPVDTGSNPEQNTQNRITQAGLGQLLSSQINNVLNSSLNNFDFDLNLTGFDQADLGIGLRLFDDRLELRRDGTIVGDQTNIGDLEATYRINRFLSVEIFHRQDINSNRRVTQNGSLDRVNGLGLQYQVQFTSWRRFFNDIWRFLSGKQS